MRSTPLDFKCDVDKAVKVVVPAAKRRRFYTVYALSWTDDEIEQGMLADRVLGGVRNSWEQRLGELFVRLGLYKTKHRGKVDNKEKA
jgi:phytoene/squalene synthetase